MQIGDFYLLLEMFQILSIYVYYYVYLTSIIWNKLQYFAPYIKRIRYSMIIGVQCNGAWILMVVVLCLLHKENGKLEILLSILRIYVFPWRDL